jgi:S-adenosylmethionine hydrolase
LKTITLMTDFGLKDGNVGVMKGVILGIAPQVTIVDLSHHITPQNVPEAALVLKRSLPYFPPGTIHVVVVDPGVGTTRRPLVASLGNQYIVGPDNGVITMALILAEAEGWAVEMVHTDNPEYWLPEVSHVFHGRDIFAPVAAHLANGVPLEALGKPIHDPVLLNLPQPERTENGWRGEVIHIDHFGNVSTNISTEHLGKPARLSTQLGNTTITGMVQTFGEHPAGDLVVLYGSTGNLIISVVNGNAAQRLGARVGDPVHINIVD